ncbi:hypothetical protein FDP73_23285 [Escherichia coli]|nr:hypothetical protein [Escherichia coli]
MSTNQSSKLIVTVGSAAGLVGSMKDLALAAKKLGLSVEKSSDLAISKDAITVAGGVLTVTSKGIAVSAEYLDSLLQKNAATENITAAGISDHVNQFTSLLTTVQSILSTSLAGVDLNALLTSGNADSLTIAKSALNIASETLKMAVSSVGSVSKFADTFSNLGQKIQNVSGLENVSSFLQGIKGLNFQTGTAVLNGVSGILGGISAGLVLGSPTASTGQKVAAGVEMTTKIVGNITKTVTQIIVAQRVAAGMSVTAPVIGLIASSVSLAISPLSFYNVAKKFEYADEILKVADKFKKYGYSGDELLANFQKEYGIVEASTAAASATLGAVSAGVGAAAAGSLVAAPVSLIVGAVAGVITAILEASKQAMINGIANQYWQKINDWEKAHPGENYFEHGYGSRYSAFVEDNLKMLNEMAEEMGAKSLVAVTQQGWDSMLGELAAVTRLGEKISSGKLYTSIISNGRVIDDANQVAVDVDKGSITLDSNSPSQALVFMAPLMSPMSESRVRVQTGKNSWSTLTLGKNKDWKVIDKGDTSTTADFSSIVQRIVFRDNSVHDITLTADMGNGDDTIYIGQGQTIVNAGDGFDTVSYSRSPDSMVVIKAIGEESGNYEVKRRVIGDVYHEVISKQHTNMGKNTESIEYRDVKVEKDYYDVTDKLHSVEQIIGSNGKTTFYGGHQTDHFYGGDESDKIYGRGGSDLLFGGKGNDIIWGGDGNDLLSGGEGNDELEGDMGDDVYLFKKGDGQDRIYDFNGEKDMLFLDGITASDIVFRRNPERQSLELTVQNSTDSITFDKWFLDVNSTQSKVGPGDNMKVESIITGDGKLITSEKIDALIGAMSTMSFKVSEVDPKQIFEEDLTKLFAVNPAF